ncbi:MAG: arginine N-succinyltransferase [Candidatus Binataceae bacterium]
MKSAGPHFLLRAARPRDHRQLLALARELDSINLPTEAGRLRELLGRSTRSFHGRIRDRAQTVYIFCAEEIATRRIVAASMIIGKHGTPTAPHYYLELDADERYSHTLRKLFRHSFLRLRYAMDGPTEIGGLIVTQAMRGHPERIGKLISWVRFMYLGRHLARFEKQVVAEMLAPMLPDHGNVFWDNYGRRVTGLSFPDADRLSTHDKEFIRALFPETPLYTFMLPAEVRDALGAVGENTRGAVHLLEQAGMRFLNQIDPFDGGPYYGGATAELEPVQNRRTVVAIAGEPPLEKQRSYLVAIENGDGFRAVRAEAELHDGGHLVVTPAVLHALKIKSHTRVDIVALP